MVQEDYNRSNKIRQLILTKIAQLDNYVSLLRNALKLSVESAVQGIVALIGLKYWLEKQCQTRSIKRTAELEEAMSQYVNSDLGVSTGAREGVMPASAIFVRNFLDELSALDFGAITAADIGFFMDAFLMRYFKGDLERLRVPIPIQDFLIGCLAPQKGETVIDPCCGVGDLLIGAMRHANSRLTVAGIDASRMASRIFMLRAAIEYGVDEASGLSLANDIMASVKCEQLFDIAMCYPTMGRRLPKIDGMVELPDKIAQMSEVQALMHCLDATKAGGRIGIILPDVLIESDYFGIVRKWVESQAELVFSCAFGAHEVNFSLPPASVSGLIFVKRQGKKCVWDKTAMAVDEPINDAVAAFNTFRVDQHIW